MKSDSNLFIYFLSHFLFLGAGFAMIADYCKTDMIISAFLGFLIGCGILYIVCKLKLNRKTNDNVTFNKMFDFCYFIFILFIMLFLLVILSSFLFSYFLPYTPSFIACLPFLILSIYLGCKNIKEIYNVAFILFVISIVIVVIKTILLSKEFQVGNILPFLDTSYKNIIKASLVYSTFSICPCFLLIDEDISFKKSFKYYAIGNIINILVILTISLILGDMVNVYSYPEYTILRRIKFFDFIENIENFICINWFFDLFISLSLLINKLKFTVKINNCYIVAGISFSILYLVFKVFSNNFYNTIILYHIFSWVCGFFIILLIVLLVIYSIIKN